MDKRLIYPSNIGTSRDTYFVREDRTYLRKHASEYHPEIAAYIEKATPIDNLVQVLLTALGAYEYWGQNVNGDQFKVPALTHKGTDYGYETFATNANYFLHHVNKDPALSKGKVLKAVWNDKAKRVELVVGIDVNLDPEGVAMIDRGENLTFSMGAKVPYDICSVCGNRAKTRAEYCDHLKYQMNQIDPVTGLLVGADNTLPKFFDISRVLIPADKTAYMWTKIAGAANVYQTIGSAELASLPQGKIADLSYLAKKAEERKEEGLQKAGKATKIAVSVKDAAITKRIPVKVSPEFSSKLEESIPAATEALQRQSPSVSPALLDKAHADGLRLEEILSTFAALGMVPKKDEMEHLVVRFNPKTEEVSRLNLAPEYVHGPLLSSLAPMLAERSFLRPVLLRRIIICADHSADHMAKNAEEIQRLVSRERTPKHHDPMYIAGALAALYLLFRDHGGGVTGGILSRLAGGAGRAIENHPAISLPVLSALYNSYSTLFPDNPPPTGFYSVDANLDGPYNRTWQSRFVDMQARPVTVIKTGAVSWSKHDKGLTKKVFVGVPAIFLASAGLRENSAASPGQQPGPIKKFISDNPELISAGLIADHLTGRPISSRVSSVINSGKRVIKQASLNNEEFLDAAPDSERLLLQDLAILDAAQRIQKKVSGR